MVWSLARPDCSKRLQKDVMNQQLQTFARETLKKGLAQCSDAQQLIFKRMYSHKNLEKPISEVVDAMPAERLDWAMQQVESTIKKNIEKDQENG
jgi:hypothetical protein